MLTSAPASVPVAVPASIPSPAESVWHLGPVPLRAYALCILAGIVLAIWLGNRRWIARGGEPGVVGDIAIWAVPFGIVGARLYHVATDYDRGAVRSQQCHHDCRRMGDAGAGRNKRR